MNNYYNNYRLTIARQYAARCKPEPHCPYLPAFEFTDRWESLEQPERVFGAITAGVTTAWQEFHTIVEIIRYHRDFYLIGTNGAEFHQAVKKALQLFGHPENIQLLALQFPRVATDGSRIAYYRTEQKIAAHAEDPEGNKHLTATTVQKYLARHWPHIPSDQIDKLAQTLQYDYGIADTMDEMLHIIQVSTAISCMSNGGGGWEDSDHPYNVYAPEYGWKLAYAKQGGEYVGRALINDTDKTFVRTYGQNDNHPGLHQWLLEKGYTYERKWAEGLKFAKVESSGGQILAPFLDPGHDRIENEDCRRVTDAGRYFVRDNQGEYTWNDATGLLEDENTEICEDCGEGFHEDEMYCVGRSGYLRVCKYCLNENCTYAYGYHGDRYYVRNEDVTYVNGEAYHEDYLSDNGIVYCENGEYASEDDAIYVEDEDEWYHPDQVSRSQNDAGDICYVNYEWVKVGDCKWCIYREEWILADDAREVADGDYVHVNDFDSYLLGLDRDEVAVNCIDCDADEIEEYLAVWDRYHEKFTPNMFKEQTAAA